MNTVKQRSRPKRKWLRRILRTGIVIFLVANILGAFHAWKLTHHYPGIENKKNPAEWGFLDKAGAVLFGVKKTKPGLTAMPDFPYTIVKLQTKNGLTLEAWHSRADSAKGTILLFHGHGGTKAGVLTEAGAFRKMGYAVFMTDFRAHGNSDGNVCSIGWKESEEVRLAYDYVSKTGEKNIILWGSSMGAAAICRAMYEEEYLQPAALILEMPFASLHDAVKGRVKMMGLPAQPVAALLTFWGGAEQGFNGFKHKTFRYAQQIQVPVLLQYGLKDTYVTRTETNRIFESIAAADKKLVVYEEAGHESLLRIDPVTWLRETENFLAAHGVK